MNELGVNKLLKLSKDAKGNKDYILEKSYLEQAYKIAPTNTKVINALIRNARKQCNDAELRKWLEILYRIKPDGKILFELGQIEKREGNFQRVKELLIENKRIAPESKKIQKRIEKVDKKIKEQNINSRNNTINIFPLTKPQSKLPKSTIFMLTEEEAKLVRAARDIIYGLDDFQTKYNKILSMLSSQSEEIILCIFCELHKSMSSSVAVNIVKNYKRGLNQGLDAKKIKLANKLLELVSSKKTRQFNWNEFWMSNSIVSSEEKENPKVLIKQAS